MSLNLLPLLSEADTPTSSPVQAASGEDSSPGGTRPAPAVSMANSSSANSGVIYAGDSEGLVWRIVWEGQPEMVKWGRFHDAGVYAVSVAQTRADDSLPNRTLSSCIISS